MVVCKHPIGMRVPLTMESATSSGVILVVEDPFIRKYVRRILDRVPYASIEAQASNAAVVLRLADPPVRMVITNDPSLFADCATGIPLIYTSAFPDLSLAAHFGSCHVLRKPFLPEDLLRAVETLAASRKL